MTNRRNQESADQSNMRKDPDDWTTGDEPMTGAQRSYLSTLAEEAGEEVPEGLTKAEAAKLTAIQINSDRAARRGNGAPRRVVSSAWDATAFCGVASWSAKVCATAP